MGQPALSLAAALQRRAQRPRAHRRAASWPGTGGVSEIGAELFALVARARAAGLDPELELRAAARAYRDQVRAWEAAGAAGPGLPGKHAPPGTSPAWPVRAPAPPPLGSRTEYHVSRAPPPVPPSGACNCGLHRRHFRQADSRLARQPDGRGRGSSRRRQPRPGGCAERRVHGRIRGRRAARRRRRLRREGRDPGRSGRHRRDPARAARLRRRRPAPGRPGADRPGPDAGQVPARRQRHPGRQPGRGQGRGRVVGPAAVPLPRRPQRARAARAR